MENILMQIDWTPLLTALIALILAGISGLIMKYAVPWLKQHNLNAAAAIAVRAVEAVYGRYHGEEKLKAAIKMVARKGLNVSEDEIIDAIKAAWQDLNTQMVEAGIKEYDDPPKDE